MWMETYTHLAQMNVHLWDYTETCLRIYMEEIGEEPKIQTAYDRQKRRKYRGGRKQMSRLKRIISELIIISIMFTSIPMVFADVEKTNESSVSEEQVINEETENNLIEENADEKDEDIKNETLNKNEEVEQQKMMNQHRNRKLSKRRRPRRMKVCCLKPA